MACVVFVLIPVLFISAVTSEIESNFYREESCAQAKGFCLLENECPETVDKDYKTLCPSQKEQGAICCKHVPQEKVNCFQTHNICSKTCPDALNMGRKGCPKGEICCLLV